MCVYIYGYLLLHYYQYDQSLDNDYLKGLTLTTDTQELAFDGEMDQVGHGGVVVLFPGFAIITVTVAISKTR